MISGTTSTVEGPMSFSFPPLVFPAKRTSASVTLPVCLIFPLLTPTHWLVVVVMMFQPAAVLRRGAAQQNGSGIVIPSARRLCVHLDGTLTAAPERLRLTDEF